MRKNCWAEKPHRCSQRVVIFLVFFFNASYCTCMLVFPKSFGNNFLPEISFKLGFIVIQINLLITGIGRQVSKCPGYRGFHQLQLSYSQANRIPKYSHTLYMYLSEKNKLAYIFTKQNISDLTYVYHCSFEMNPSFTQFNWTAN